MTTYHAKVGGNDALNGLSWDNAWETVHKAAITATAGDVVIFGDGTYYMPGAESSWNSGTSGNIITFQSDTRRGATWLQTADYMKVDLEGVDYVTFQELIIRSDQTYTQSSHVYMKTSDHIILNDCEIYNGNGWLVVLDGACTNITIRDCACHSENILEQMGGIEITHAGNQYITIDGVEIYHTAFTGIQATQVSNLSITNCHVHDVGAHGMSIRAVTVGEVLNCRVHDCDTGYCETDHNYHNGIRVTAYPAEGEGTTGASDITIRGNDVYHNQTSGIAVREDAAGPINIYNNTLYDNNQDPTTGMLDCGSFRLFATETTENKEPVVRFKNNIIFVTQTDARTMLVDAALETNFDADYNLFYSTSGTKEVRRNGTTYTTYTAYQAVDYESHTVIDDNPDFIDPANADFTLQGDSPAIDQGVDIGESYYGAAPDIGAHEYEPTNIICMIM